MNVTHPKAQYAASLPLPAVTISSQCRCLCLRADQSSRGSSAGPWELTIIPRHQLSIQSDARLLEHTEVSALCSSEFSWQSLLELTGRAFDLPEELRPVMQIEATCPLHHLCLNFQRSFSTLSSCSSSTRTGQRRMGSNIVR